MTEKSEAIIGKMQGDIASLQHDVASLKDNFVSKDDFASFKSEIIQVIKEAKLSLFIQLSSVTVISMGVAFIAFAYINDYRLDFTNEQNNARFERLEGAVYHTLLRDGLIGHNTGNKAQEGQNRRKATVTPKRQQKNS